MSHEEILEEIKKNYEKKTCQENHVPTKIIEMKPDHFEHFLPKNFNDTNANHYFRKPKNTNKRRCLKRVTETMKEITGLSAFFQTYLRHMKNVFINNCHK